MREVNLGVKRGFRVKKFLAVFLVVGMATFAMSCRTFQATGLEVSLTGSSVDVLGDFRASVWVNKFLGTSGGGNLFNLSSDAKEGAVIDLVKKEIANKGGDRAINVKVVYTVNPLQYVLNWVTGQIWAPASIVVTGTVVKDRPAQN